MRMTSSTSRKLAMLVTSDRYPKQAVTTPAAVTHPKGTRDTGAPIGPVSALWLCAAVALPPVPGQGDQAADHVGRQSWSAREVRQRRVLIFGRPGVRRPHLGFSAGQDPPARTRRPAELVLDHAQGAGGNVLAGLELPECPLGHPGRLGKGAPVAHA